MIDWHNGLSSDFLNHGSDIRTVWLRGFYCTDTKVRTAVLKDKSQWREYASEVLLPWYKDGLDWSHPEAKNYQLSEFANEHATDNQFSLRNEQLRVLSVYHNLLNRRLLVDGCHRAVAIEIAVKREIEVREVEVVEAYGSQIHAIFPCDFANLLREKIQLPLRTQDSESSKATKSPAESGPSTAS